MNVIVVLLVLSIGVSPIIGARNRNRNREIDRSERFEDSEPNYPFEVEYGSCPEPRSVQNFNPMRFTGTWYAIKHYKNEMIKGKCGTAVFTWSFENQIMNFTYTNLETAEYIQLTPDDLENGIFNLHRYGRQLPIDFYLLETDYVNYAITWACVEIDETKNGQLAIIFGRTRTLSPGILDSAENVLASRKLSVDKLQNVEQKRRVCGGGDY